MHQKKNMCTATRDRPCGQVGDWFHKKKNFEILESVNDNWLTF